MKILLTGAGGQIGHDLVHALAAAGHDVVATDLRPMTTTAAGVTWRGLDVTDAAACGALLDEVRPAWVFHLAAVLSATGERDPVLAYNVNQTGTWNLLEACRAASVERFMFCSTIAVFGSPPHGPVLPDPTPDDVPLRPSTMYGITKVAGELLCEYYGTRFGLDCRGVRFPGLISAAVPGGGSSDYALFMYVDGIRHGRYEAFCRPDTRIPLMYMPDAVQALLDLAHADRSKLTRSIYNISGFSPRADQIAAAVALAMPNVEITYAPDPVRQAILDSWPRALDASLAERDWGFRAHFDLAGMTADLVPALRALVATTAS